MAKRRSARSPSAELRSSSAATTSVADQRAATIQTARTLCRFVALICLAQALREEEARAAVAAGCHCDTAREGKHVLDMIFQSQND